MKIRVGAASFAFLLLSGILCAQSPQGNYDESKVGRYTLPDPLVFNNGKPVRTERDWMRKRRPEILELFAEDEYGHSPRPPRRLTYQVTEAAAPAFGGKATRQQVTIYFSPDRKGPAENLLIYLPASQTQAVPLILTLNYIGNQSVTNDPGVKLALIWTPKTHERRLSPESSRGKDKEFEVEKILSRGYGFATICYQDIEPDFKGGISHSIRPLFFKPGQTEPRPSDWGAIGAWSFGLSRAMDYLEKDKHVDSRRVAIMGHSRLGKTVLWAGAMDSRFAMVIASCPGEGGASLARRNYGETIRNLIDNFPYWFCVNFARYAPDPSRLPVDTHELIALIAPRPLYITGAQDDQWADPKGEFLAEVAAGPVYTLLHAHGLGTDQMPPLNTPIMHTLAFHYRTGKHEVTSFDWDQFLRFADLQLKRNGQPT